MLQIFRRFLPLTMLVLGIFEVVAMFLAVYFIVGINLPNDSGSGFYQAQLIHFALLLAVLAVGAMIAMGLYNYEVFLDTRVMIIKLIMAFLLLLPIGFIFALLYQDSLNQTSNNWPLHYAIIIGVLLTCSTIARFIFMYTTNPNWFKRRTLVLGTGQLAARIEALETNRQNRHFSIMGFIPACNDRRLVDSRRVIDTINLAFSNSLLKESMVQQCAEIVVATDDRRGLPIHQLLHCKMNGVSVVDYLTFWERENSRIDLDALYPSWLVHSEGFSVGSMSLMLKRFFDVGVSLGLLILTLPVILIAGLMIKLDSPGPVMERQERVGHNGAIFNLIKFRTMTIVRDEEGTPRTNLQDFNPTRIGALLRKFRIDELPQLINILLGRMSFIGPYPERPKLVAQLAEAIPFYEERHAVKPGITGWAQINYLDGISIDDARQKLSYDLYYVKNIGFFVDIIILMTSIHLTLWPHNLSKNARLVGGNHRHNEAGSY